MQSQQLLQPLALPFSSAEVDIICDHVRIFERNGYKFRRGPTGVGLQLTAIPELLGSTMSKQDDLEELLHVSY
jgi:DNA mismatch repair ATPase MutL